MWTMILSVAASVGLADFAFLQGNWCASALGGQVIERWEAPFGGAMTGTMSVVKDQQVQFYELFVLARTEGGWELRLKHFNDDMVSWEERDEVKLYPLLQAKPGLLVFEGLSMKSQDGGRGLLVTVHREQPIVFDYQRCE